MTIEISLEQYNDMAERLAELEWRLGEAVQGWIPCSERLPSDDEYVIVSILDDHGDTPWKYTTVAWLCNGVWISDSHILWSTVVAWMPLPEPYEGECATCKHKDEPWDSEACYGCSKAHSGYEWDETINGKYQGKNRLRG